jgi:hypothetical protein
MINHGKSLLKERKASKDLFMYKCLLVVAICYTYASAYILIRAY